MFVSLSEIILSKYAREFEISPDFVIDCAPPEVGIEADLVDIRYAPDECLDTLYSCFRKIGVVQVSQTGPHHLPNGDYDFRVSYDCSGDVEVCDINFILANNRVTDLFIDTFGTKRTFIGDWESNQNIISFGICSPPDNFGDPMKMAERNRRALNEKIHKSPR